MIHREEREDREAIAAYRLARQGFAIRISRFLKKDS
jgi:hypothetical protein